MAAATLERPASTPRLAPPALDERSLPEPRLSFTPEDLLALPGGEHMELVDGRTVERSMGFSTSLVTGELFAALHGYVRQHRLGWTPPQECGYQCFSPDRSRVRKPDASFIALERMPEHALHEGFVRIPPDLAVEVVSPNDLAEEIRGKAEDYLQAGVRLVWVVYLEAGVADVLRANGSTTRVAADGDLDGEDVLPGFRCRLGDLFPPRPTTAAPTAE